MSNITGEGGSFSSGNTTAAVGEADVQQQELLINPLNSIASTTVATSTTNGSTAQQHQPSTVKKKRNLPGNPDPSAEVIALSPKTLLATNRFICEICNKGFQRDQNLQLHRRGHNLPWKLRQRTSTEIRKRVYICPELSCVHHNPARALGDLTGIKKHFCRKHGEKKWKCDKCSKKYAVQSDWKAHTKTCGTKEYKCDCGTIFSRRDSFITHRAFCDALTEENNKANQGLVPKTETNLQSQVPNLISIPINNNQDQPMIMSNLSNLDTRIPLSLPHELMPMPTKPSGAMFSSGTTSLFGGGRSLSNCSSSFQLSANSSTVFEGNAHLAAGSISMSATALLQKAAQMGATASPTTHKSFVAGMASSTFGPMQNSNDQSQVTARGNGGFINQFFNANGGIENPAANNVGLINGELDQTSGLFKNIEQETRNDKSFFHGVNSSTPGLISSGLTRFSGDVMTVDFLGVGGSRQRNLHEHHKQEMEFRGIVHPRIHQGLGQFEQTALEKPMWDV